MKSKGFTLIELLAVIVILAILILTAAPNVVKIVNNATKTSFSNEAQSMIKYFQMAYSDALFKRLYTLEEVNSIQHFQGIDNYYTAEYKDYKSLKHFIKTRLYLNRKNVSVKVLCYTLQDLVDDGYMEKNLDGYDGTVVAYTLEDNSIWYVVWITDGKFKFDYVSGDKVYQEKLTPYNEPNKLSNCVYFENAILNMDGTIEGKTGITLGS